MDENITRFLNEIHEKYGDEVYRRMRREVEGVLKELGEAEAHVSYVQDLRLNDVPMLVLVGNGKRVAVYYDHMYDRVVVRNEDEIMYLCTSEDFNDYTMMVTLDPSKPEVCILDEDYEELTTYGNRFSLIIETEKYYYKVRGMFLDKIVYMLMPEILDDEEYEEVVGKVRELMPDLLGVLGSYVWHPIDRYRGMYIPKKTKGRFIQVVEGWASTEADENVRRLAKVANMEEDPPVTPILFVYPRSSNLMVTYFDVYVLEEDVDKFVKWFGKVDSFSLTEGYYVKTVA